MKPTHILVSIAQIEAINKLEGSVTDKVIMKAGLLFESPSVDLSEEGIRAKAEELFPHREIYEIKLREAYKQCAKDLLNTK